MKPSNRSTEPLTRQELAKTLGVGKSTIRRWEAEGKAKCFKNEKGVHLFRLEDVAKLIGDRPIVRLNQASCHVPSAADAGGDLAARIYELLDANKHPNDIVREIRVHPDVLDGFIERCRGWNKGMVLTPSAMVAPAERSTHAQS